MTVERIREILFEPEEGELDAQRVEDLAREVLRAVGDPKMHPSIAMRAARACAERRMSAVELKEILDIVTAQRLAGRLRSPGAYFVTSLKRVFQRQEIPW